LLVEDNDINALVAQTFLEKMGHTVFHAETGEDGIHAVKGEKFDVILMDISLPGMDGIEAAQQIRSLSGGDHRHVPIVAMSAHVFQNEISAVLEADMNAFIGKPLSPERLAEVLNEVTTTIPLLTSSIVNSNDESSGTSYILDATVLRDDLAVIGLEKTTRMVTSFLNSSIERHQQFSMAVDKKDWASAIFAAHYLKGSASSLGLRALANYAESLEKAMRGEGSTLNQEQVNQFKILHDDSREALQSYWTQLTATTTSQRSTISAANT